MPVARKPSRRDPRAEDVRWSRPVDDRPDGQSLTDARFARDAQAWAEIYEQSDVRSIIHQRRLSRALRVIDGLSLPPAASLLEVGCGAGLLTTALARRGGRVVAVDRLAPMIDFAKGRLRRAGLEDRATLVRADASSLPFPAGSFHLVVGLGLVMWVPDPKRALHEMSRVLEPGGLILVNASNRLGMTRWLDPIGNPLVVPLKPPIQALLHRLGLWGPRDVPRLTDHSVREFDALLRAVGLEPERSWTIGFGPLTFFRSPVLPTRLGVSVDRWLQPHADRGVPLLRSLGTQYLVLARKT